MTRCSKASLATWLSILRLVGVLGNRSILTRGAPVDDEPRLLRDGLQGVGTIVHLDGERHGLVVAPAEALHEEISEVEGLKARPQIFNRDGRQSTRWRRRAAGSEAICRSSVSVSRPAWE